MGEISFSLLFLSLVVLAAQCSSNNLTFFIFLSFFLCGSLSEKGDALGDLWSAATALYPALDGLEIIDRFDGTRPVSPTGLPHIGPALDVEGLYLAFGHDRNGVLLAPLTAARVAAWVTAP